MVNEFNRFARWRDAALFAHVLTSIPPHRPESLGLPPGRMSVTILVVDDEKNIRRTLRMILETDTERVVEADSVGQAKAQLQDHTVDLAILDLRLPDGDGRQILKHMGNQDPDVPVLVMSGHASVTEAVDAVKDGAVDFFEKPLDRARVHVAVKNALKTRALSIQLKEARSNQVHEIIGQSPRINDLRKDIARVAATHSRVLILGDSGTGKELVARAIHDQSPRAHHPFIRVNCAAIPAELIESELFGHVKGAFTNAIRTRRGYFEQAHGGTLFLDEIGDMNLNAQVKLLRTLQTGEVSKVGGETVTTVDTRVVAATNQDLTTKVADGSFREDLYFRLNVIPIHTPKLADHPEDIPLLVHAFLKTVCVEQGLPLKPIEPEALVALERQPWRGNVRELRNHVERLVILSGPRITADDVWAQNPSPTTERRRPTQDFRLSLREHRDRSERDYIEDALRAAQWNISKAAELLQVERTNLHKKMRAYGIQRPAHGKTPGI